MHEAPTVAGTIALTPNCAVSYRQAIVALCRRVWPMNGGERLMYRYIKPYTITMAIRHYHFTMTIVISISYEFIRTQ